MTRFLYEITEALKVLWYLVRDWDDHEVDNTVTCMKCFKEYNLACYQNCPDCSFEVARAGKWEKEVEK